MGVFPYVQLLQMTSVTSVSLADTYSGYEIHTNVTVIIAQSQVLETETFRVIHITQLEVIVTLLQAHLFANCLISSQNKVCRTSKFIKEYFTK